MFSPETSACIPGFKAKKQSQWERISGSMPGLQLVASGEQGSQAMLVCSSDDFYEGVVIGQLPQVVMEVSGSPRNPVRRPMAEDKKPMAKREIDLTDEQIDQVLARWQERESALSLSFVLAVSDASGRTVTR